MYHHASRTLVINYLGSLHYCMPTCITCTVMWIPECIPRRGYLKATGSLDVSMSMNITLSYNFLTCQIITHVWRICGDIFARWDAWYKLILKTLILATQCCLKFQNFLHAVIPEVAINGTSSQKILQTNETLYNYLTRHTFIQSSYFSILSIYLIDPSPYFSTYLSIHPITLYIEILKPIM